MEIICYKTISISYYVRPVLMLEAHYPHLLILLFSYRLLRGEQGVNFTLIESVNFSVSFQPCNGIWNRGEVIDFKIRVCTCARARAWVCVC